MEMTMRWFGSNADKIKLSEIAQVPGVDYGHSSGRNLAKGENQST